MEVKGNCLYCNLLGLDSGDGVPDVGRGSEGHVTQLHQTHLHSLHLLVGLVGYGHAHADRLLVVVNLSEGKTKSLFKSVERNRRQAAQS